MQLRRIPRRLWAKDPVDVYQTTVVSIKPSRKEVTHDDYFVMAWAAICNSIVLYLGYYVLIDNNVLSKLQFTQSLDPKELLLKINLYWCVFVVIMGIVSYMIGIWTRWQTQKIFSINLPIKCLLDKRLIHSLLINISLLSSIGLLTYLLP